MRFKGDIAYLRRLVRRLFSLLLFSPLSQRQNYIQDSLAIFQILAFVSSTVKFEWTQGYCFARLYILCPLSATYMLYLTLILRPMLALRRIATLCGGQLALAEPQIFYMKSVHGVCLLTAIDQLVPIKQTELSINGSSLSCASKPNTIKDNNLREHV